MPLKRSFYVWESSLAWELRAISQLILKKFEYNILVYFNYSGPKYWGLEKNVVNSVTVKTFSRLKYQATEITMHILIIMNTCF